MSYNPEKLMAYLYGELSQQEEREIEKLLKESEEAKAELEEMRSTMGILGSLKDREVEAPTFTFQNPRHIIAEHSSSSWKTYLSVAASIALILCVGYLTGFKVSNNEQGFKVAFGESSSSFSQEQVDQMIAAAIAENNNQIDEKLKANNVSVKEYVDAGQNEMEIQLISQVSNLSYDKQRTEYLSMLKQMLESSELAQQKYTDEVLTDFAIFLDIQRQNDLNVIQTRFDNLRDDAKLNQLQTNQILSNLITNDGNANQY